MVWGLVAPWITSKPADRSSVNNKTASLSQLSMRLEGSLALSLSSGEKQNRSNSSSNTKAIRQLRRDKPKWEWLISIPFSLPLLFEYRLSYSECNKNPACLQINSVISKSFGWSHQSRRNPMGKSNVCSWLSLSTMGAIRHRISDAKSGIMLHSVIRRHRYQTPYFTEYHSCFQGLTSLAGTQQRLTCSKFVEGIY